MVEILALPCRYVIVKPSRYHECVLLTGALCQACNPNLTDIRFTLKFPTIVDFKNGGIKRTLDTDGISEITEYYDPKNELDLDSQCPAGYTWEQVQTKSDALNKIILKNTPPRTKGYLKPAEKDEARRINASRINTIIQELYQTAEWL